MTGGVSCHGVSERFTMVGDFMRERTRSLLRNERCLDQLYRQTDAEVPLDMTCVVFAFVPSQLETHKFPRITKRIGIHTVQHPGSWVVRYEAYRNGL